MCNMSEKNADNPQEHSNPIDMESRITHIENNIKLLKEIMNRLENGEDVFGSFRRDDIDPQDDL